jgi:hypothetical protein
MINIYPSLFQIDVLPTKASAFCPCHFRGKKISGSKSPQSQIGCGLSAFQKKFEKSFLCS